jgi:hypothetical protein
MQYVNGRYAFSKGWSPTVLNSCQAPRSIFFYWDPSGSTRAFIDPNALFRYRWAVQVFDALREWQGPLGYDTVISATQIGDLPDRSRNDGYRPSNTAKRLVHVSVNESMCDELTSDNSTSSFIAAKRPGSCSRTIIAWGVSRRRKSCVWSFMMSRFYGLPYVTKKREGLIPFYFWPLARIVWPPSECCLPVGRYHWYRSWCTFFSAMASAKTDISQRLQIVGNGGTNEEERFPAFLTCPSALFVHRSFRPLGWQYPIGYTRNARQI